MLTLESKKAAAAANVRLWLGSEKPPVTKRDSYRQILKSSSIIGSASFINLLVGLMKTKVAAEVLGPVGIGLIGILQNLLVAGSTAAGLSFGTVGTRQIAEANGRQDRCGVVVARRALFWGTLFLAVVGGVVFVAFRELIAKYLVSDPELAQSVAWLGGGVALAVAASSQVALLRGLRKTGDIARVSVLSALFSCVVGLPALVLLEDLGIVIFVIASPLASFVIGHIYVARLPRVESSRAPFAALLQQWKVLSALGTILTVTSLLVVCGQLVVRVTVNDQIGIEAAGLFQAAWVIAATYVGMIITAMGTDYYPRLTEVIHDRVSAQRLVNEQSEVVLMLTGPLLVGMVALAPWIVEFLYSAEFSGAAEILAWQTLGNVLKVASWPIGLALLVAGLGRIFLFIEAATVTCFVVLSFVGIPIFGVESTGIAFLTMYAIRLPLVCWFARSHLNISLSVSVKRQVYILTVVSAGVFAIAQYSVSAAVITGTATSIALGFVALRKLSKAAKLPRVLANLVGTKSE